MTFEQNINDSIKKAMLNKNEAELRALRAIKSAVILFKTSSEFKREISQNDEIKLLQKLVKQRNDSITIFENQNRPELAQKEKEELAIIESFLPKQLSEEELILVINQCKEELGNVTSADMGKLIGLVNKKVAGQADGKKISTLVKQLLG